MLGIGIITCNRPHFFEKCYQSLPFEQIDKLVVVNDGTHFPYLEKLNQNTVLIQHDSNKHVGESKNVAMRYLLDSGCNYIFTLEDDIILKNQNIFNAYIQAHKDTGLHHFNFGFSQRENLDHLLNPVWKLTVDYKNSKIVLNQNILGAFTFYTKKCLQAIGLHHKQFNKGHGDHLELTYRAYKHGFTTPFWWFADIFGSWNMIENQSNFTTDSQVRTPETFHKNFNEARNIFKTLHGCDIFDIPQLPQNEVIQILKNIKNENT